MRISDWSSDVCSSDLDWTVHSAALAEREWKDAGEQWNAPTSRTLAPGEAIEVGVRLVQAPSIRAIESTLIAHQPPVAIGIPGVRTSVVSGKSVSVRFILGARRSIPQKNI